MLTIELSSGTAAQVAADAIVVFAFAPAKGAGRGAANGAGKTAAPAVLGLPAAWERTVAAALARRGFSARLSATTSVDVAADVAKGARTARAKAARGRGAGKPADGPVTIVVAGLGDAATLDAAGLRQAAAAGVRAARAAGAARAVLVPPPLPEGHGLADDGACTRALAEAALLGTYRFDRLRGAKARAAAASSASAKLRTVVLADTDGREARAARDRALAVADAVAFARDLVNLPANHLGPEQLAAEARRAVRGTGVRVVELAGRALAREKMGALLAVARGADTTPRVVHLAYRPRARARARLVFVGKGITFDAGGYNLKTGDSMDTMKCDMAGAAAVIGAVRALARLRVPVEVHGVVGLCENLVNGRAFKPGDVLTTRSGQTVEINNTDAEGRLVLADLLDYVRTKIGGADAIVDLATLTGACVVALGPLCSGLFTNADTLAQALGAAAARAGEQVWRLPLVASYRDQLESAVADMKNCGTRWGGAITAALFLENFVDAKTAWAHLDIAGPAFLDRDHAFHGRGGTGAGVATLVEYALAAGSRRS